MKTLYRDTDLCVIGSGFGAAAPAMRMAQAGASVLILDRGPMIRPEKDLKQSMHPDYLRRYYHQLDGDGMSMTTVRAWGGASGFYLGISLRSPSMSFDQQDADGQRLWPEFLDRQFLDQYYDRAEHMLGVKQVGDNDVSRNGQIFSQIMHEQGGTSDRVRLAVSDCKKCGFCVTGCVHGSKHALYENYLPSAVSAGAQVMTDTRVNLIEPSPSSSGYLIFAERRTGTELQHLVIRASRVCLSAGTVGTAEILLRSRKALNLHTPIARHVQANIFYKRIATLPEALPDGEMYRGYGLPNVVSYDYLSSDEMVVIPYKAIPAQLMIRLRYGSDAQSWWGEQQVERMMAFRHRTFVLTASGSMPGSAQLSLHQGRMRLKYQMSASHRAIHRHREGILEDILRSADMSLGYAEEIDNRGRLRRDLHYTTTHQVGSCPIGTTTTERGQLIGHPGIYISDGSLVPASTIVPPSLTILAMGEYVAEQMLQD